MNPRENFETPMLVPLGTLVSLAKRNIGQGSSKSGNCFGNPSLVLN